MTTAGQCMGTDQPFTPSPPRARVGASLAPNSIVVLYSSRSAILAGGFAVASELAGTFLPPELSRSNISLGSP